ncbi:MAG: tetratricopeptide repeat protein [bacterium]|nr:tetratricopeptide repeat protein [bacterium]
MALIPILFLLIIGIAYFAWKSHQKTVQTWRRIASELGLEISVKSSMARPAMRGTFNGLPVTIDTYTQRSGNSNTTYTRYRVNYPPLGLGLKMRREGGLSFIGKLFGIEDAQVGDPVFDEAFKISTSDQPRLSAFLTPSVRSSLLRLMASYPSAVITDNSIQVVKARFEGNGDVLASTTQRIVATAQQMASPSAGVSDTMVKGREQGLLGDVAERIREAVESHPEDVDQRIFELETLAAAGDDTQAAERLRELERMAPADPDVAGWKQALDTPAQPSSEMSETIDVDVLAKDLFGGEDLSFETRTKFNSQYAGRKISWEGKVKQVRESGDKAQATIVVATVHNDLYGNTDIAVVVDGVSRPVPGENQQVTVSGTLNTIDPLMRNLFVTDARLS